MGNRIDIHRTDNAVSPVIAVILLIALVVVIAAVFAAVVIGMPSAITPAKVVGVTASSYTSGSDSGIRMTLYGGKDFGQLVSVRAQAGGYTLYLDGKEGVTNVTNPVIGIDYNFALLGVKEEVTLDGTTVELTSYIDVPTLIGAPVTFIGTFADGTEQVIYMWKFSFSGSSDSAGLYVNGPYVSVAGYFASDGIDVGTGKPGHGLYIKKIADNVSDVKVTACDLRDSQNNVYNYRNDMFSTNASVHLNKDGYTYLIMSPTKAERPYAPLSSDRVFFPEGTNADCLTGNITLEITFTDNHPIQQEIHVVIPERLSIFSTDKYSAKIFEYTPSSSKSSVQVSINPTILSEERQKIALVVAVDGKPETLIITPPLHDNEENYFEEGGHTFTWGGNLNGYDPNAVLQVYLLYSNDGSPAWFLIGSTPIADLINGS